MGVIMRLQPRLSATYPAEAGPIRRAHNPKVALETSVRLCVDEGSLSAVM